MLRVLRRASFLLYFAKWLPCTYQEHIAVPQCQVLPSSIVPFLQMHLLHHVLVMILGGTGRIPVRLGALGTAPY